MDSDVLLDQLTVAWRHHNLITVILKRLPGITDGIIVTGTVVAVARRYAATSPPQIVLDRVGQDPLAFSLSQVREFHPGPRRPDDHTDRQVHPTHLPEPDDAKLSNGIGRACRRCCRFVTFEGATFRVTDSGAAPCTPVRVTLRSADPA